MRRFDLSHRPDVAGEPAVVVHRAALQHLLLEAARGIPINLARPAVGVRAGDGRVLVVMADGSSVPADLVVGADGLHSAVRASVLGDGPPRYTGLTTWRAVVEAGDLVTEASLSVGNGYQFIASSLPQGRIYWGATAHLPEGSNGAMREARSFLVECFGGWHRPIPDLIEATPERDIVCTNVYDRAPPERVTDGSVALVGDAAHPMTPDLGQGGCQALEDAVVLGACFEQHGEVAAAIAAYQAHRLRRVRRIVRDSHLIGQIFGARGALVTRPRDLLISGTPEVLSRRQLARYGSREAFLATLPNGAVPGGTMVSWSRTDGHNRRRWPTSGRA
jgi:2-polyprenyl-6-methoxyphenol hydroxylase-like FAD-dependent oxidoreductase